jgi:hypothetical protein
MGKGDFARAAEASLKAAEAFNELAKHSTGKAHQVAYQRAKTLVEITKILRQEEPLPLDLVEALDSFFPVSESPLPPAPSSKPPDAAASSEERQEENDDDIDDKPLSSS